ncbi:choloylglycine hydrolase family protein [Staphylococcus xylosus]|uniref:choloylglycine hydrolase family protein n=1 Tax=Staphylococcus xylosus TaxID=1288 RepID=UPI001F236480|nr:choloylglycine hydrolase family protein [Staphylococcus xylosus]MCE4995691.1 choloylglycine hydrolase family protein [Staphylococcus xylosus]
MCTGFSYLSKSNQVILGRTMDFVYQLKGNPAVQPRHFYWESRITYKGKTKYGFVGSGSDMEGFLFADGVNEHGLGASIQYFRGYATYATDVREGYMNIAQSEVITWVLGYNQNIEDLIKNAKSVNVVAHTLNDIAEVPPLHYHITDDSGRTIELTFEDGSMIINENPVGVLTNNPDLNWHYENLRNYINITPQRPQAGQLMNTIFPTLGNEGGTYGLPGGYTSAERFVRMAYLKNNLEETTNAEEDILNAFKLLENVSIPKGAVRDEEAALHYTLYQTVLNLTTRIMYIKWYDSNQITELQLTEDLLNKKELTIFEPVSGLVTNRLN